MRLVFAGTPPFAATALEALIAAGHEIALALTQPDRRAGRGLQVQVGAVKAAALRHGIAVIQPAGLRIGGRNDVDARDAHERLAATPHDAMVVAAYGLILPTTILAIPPHGCINIHASLLPRWRGAAPIQRAIEAGDAATGITIMQMDAGLDTGDVLAMHRTPIDRTDTTATLTERLAELGGRSIVAVLASIASGTSGSRPQHGPGDASSVTYAAKVDKSEARLDFSQPSRTLVDRIRAFDPWPGCHAVLRGPASDGAVSFKVWHAESVSDALLASLPSTGRSGPGAVLGLVDAGTVPGGAVIVATGDGAVALTELQKPGGRRLHAAAFRRDFTNGGSLFFSASADG